MVNRPCHDYWYLLLVVCAVRNCDLQHLRAFEWCNECVRRLSPGADVGMVCKHVFQRVLENLLFWEGSWDAATLAHT